MARIAYVNGRFVPLNKAQVSIEDRGYQFADGIYEVIALIQGCLIDLKEHLKRLEQSLSLLHIDQPVKKETLAFLINQTIHYNKVVDGVVYVQITRGVAPRAHVFSSDIKSSLIISVKPHSYVKEIAVLKGEKAIVLPDQRWARPDIKSIALLSNILAKQQAFKEGAFEAILVNEKGLITEGSHSNIFIVEKEGVLKTHPATHSILNGITRQTILRLCHEDQIPVREVTFSETSLFNAEEVFLTGTTSLVKPITKINDEMIGRGEVGYFTKRIAALYRNYYLKEKGGMRLEKHRSQTIAA
jgi:D-alanine transaminase